MKSGAKISAKRKSLNLEVEMELTAIHLTSEPRSSRALLVQ